MGSGQLFVHITLLWVPSFYHSGLLGPYISSSLQEKYKEKATHTHRGSELVTKMNI